MLSTCIKQKLFIICAMLMISSIAFAQKYKTVEMDSYLQQMQKDGKLNGVVLIADKNKVIFDGAFGYADASKKVPLSMDYRFHIGSVAKEFDAVGIMMLKEQGKLNLTDKLSCFFPNFPAWAQKISVLNLLQYTSGLPEVQWKTVHSDTDNWRDLQALQKLDFEPGASYAYNNNNTFMRRRIIEKVSGMSFNNFVLKKILPKADIRDGVVDPTGTDAMVAQSFDNDFKQDGLAVPISGWTCLTADGLYRWSKCINNFSIIGPASTKTILIPIGEGKQSGLGGGTMRNGKVLTHVHDGKALHYQALQQINTAKGRIIILLTSQNQDNVYEIAAALEKILDN